MNEAPTTPAPAAPKADPLQIQLDTLQRLVVMTLVMTLGIGISLAAYLYGQNRIVKSSLRESEAFIRDYNERAVPKLKELETALERYAASHPDLLPVLQKYGMGPQRPAAPTGAAPAAAPRR